MNNTINLNGKEWYFAQDHAEIEETYTEVSWNLLEDRQKIVGLLNESILQIKNQEYRAANYTYQKLKDGRALSRYYNLNEINSYLCEIYNNQGLCYAGMDNMEQAYENFIYAAMYEVFHLQVNGDSNYNYELMLDDEYCDEYMIGSINLCTAYKVLCGASLFPSEIVRYINYCYTKHPSPHELLIVKLIEEFKLDLKPTVHLNIRLQNLTYERKALEEMWIEVERQKECQNSLKKVLAEERKKSLELSSKLTSQFYESERYKKSYKKYFSMFSKAREDIKNLEEVTRKLHNTQKELRQAESKNDRQQEELKRIKVELKALKARKATDNNDVKTLAVENESLRQQLDVLRQREKDLFSDPENRAEFWEKKYDELKTETEERSKARIEKERQKSEKNQAELQKLREKVAIIDDVILEKESLDTKYREIYSENQYLKEYIALIELQDSNKNLLDFNSEAELYPGEIKNILLDCIEHELKNAREHSRRYDVLTSIIKMYGHSDVDEKSQKVKNLFKGYRSLDAKISQELAKFNIQSQDTKKHVKVSLAGDPRYTIAISSSGSDRLGGINTANDIIKMFF